MAPITCTLFSIGSPYIGNWIRFTIAMNRVRRRLYSESLWFWRSAQSRSYGLHDTQEMDYYVAAMQHAEGSLGMSSLEHIQALLLVLLFSLQHDIGSMVHCVG